MATCDRCLAELADPDDRRHRYPFTNCTDCGPRFTIISALPYDRASTSMASFALCPRCAAEYADPADRRFHAEPTACPGCGPRLALHRGDDTVLGTDDVLAAVHAELASGGVVAVKGIGGYHLACDATDDSAVSRLRRRKGRVAKPFAVMVPDLDAARQVAVVGPAEAEALSSPARPIVLPARAGDAPVSPGVAPDNPLLGVLLPYSPLRHLPFAPVPGSDVAPPRVLVLTSGNVSDERICFEDDDARVRLAGLADAVCTHDRPIVTPCDDSVVRLVDGQVVPVRRSRGFAPLPIRLPVTVAPTVAFGGELKATVCVASGSRAWMSQHIGDLGDLDTERALESIRSDLCRMYGVQPEIHAVDRHPGYRTHRLAVEQAWPGRVEVQHHHAHVAAVMAEHGLDGSHPVIGVAFDGTGYGTAPDGAVQIWGGEILVADYVIRLRAGTSPRSRCREATPPYATRAVWRSPTWMPSGSRPTAPPTRGRLRCHRAGRRRPDGGDRAGCVPTTSMGRLFDAVASLLGIRHRVTYEAQAAIELEAAATPASPRCHSPSGCPTTACWTPAPSWRDCSPQRARC